MEFPNIVQKFDTKIQLLIEKQNAILIDLVEKMAKQYTKMQNQYKELLTVYERTKDSHGIDFVTKQAIYQTCPLKTFGKA